MKNNLGMKKQSGFTLIEIAIVMVIIGLLIGGVLKGQALIDNAKIRSVITDLDGVQAAYYGYYDRKHVYPTSIAPMTNYISADGTGDFWFQTRTEGLTKGDPTSTTTGINAMGGFIGVINSGGTTGLYGDAVCTSVQNKFAQGIDAGIDDGVATSGTVRGLNTTDGSLNKTFVGATPMTTNYGTSGYIILCKQL